MLLEDSLLSLLYVSFNICAYCMCRTDSFGSNTKLILLQIHVEYRTSIAPSAANKTL